MTKPEDYKVDPRTIHIDQRKQDTRRDAWDRDYMPADWVKQNYQINAQTIEYLSNLINPLVVTEYGQLLPFAYGVNPELALKTDAKYRNIVRPNASILQNIFKRSLNEPQFEYTDWYEDFVHCSYL